MNGDRLHFTLLTSHALRENPGFTGIDPLSAFEEH
jgi:hypothetical protein